MNASALVNIKRDCTKTGAAVPACCSAVGFFFFNSCGAFSWASSHVPGVFVGIYGLDACWTELLRVCVYGAQPRAMVFAPLRDLRVQARIYLLFFLVCACLYVCVCISSPFLVVPAKPSPVIFFNICIVYGP